MAISLAFLALTNDLFETSDVGWSKITAQTGSDRIDWTEVLRFICTAQQVNTNVPSNVHVSARKKRKTKTKEI